MNAESSGQSLPGRDNVFTLNSDYSPPKGVDSTGGRGGGGMEPRVAKLEVIVERIENSMTDIKNDAIRNTDRIASILKWGFGILAGAIITIACGLGLTYKSLSETLYAQNTERHNDYKDISKQIDRAGDRTHELILRTLKANK